MENNSNSGVIYQGKIPNRVKYCFAFGAYKLNDEFMKKVVAKISGKAEE